MSGPGLCEGVGNTSQVQGCVRPDTILREEVINVTDFTGATAGDCTQRCRELEGEGFALTRSEQINKYQCCQRLEKNNTDDSFPNQNKTSIETL